MVAVYRDGNAHVLTEKCSSCIFRSVNDGRIQGLRPGRVADMVLKARSTDSGNIPCHSTLPHAGTSVQPAICRGFWDLPHRPALLQAVERLGRVIYDPAPPPLY